MMKAVVDGETCVGCELCVDTCPAVFEMVDGVAKAIVEEVPEGDQDSCAEAADSCPVDAIALS